MPVQDRAKTKQPPQGLKALRAACGLTQPALAKMLGVSWRTIVAIEVGQRNLNREMAERIMVATGALPDCLLQAGASLLDLNGQPYTGAFFEQWKSVTATRQGGQTNLSPDVQESIERSRLLLELLQRAAANKNRLLAVQYLFQTWMDQMMADFDLRQSFQDVCVELGLSRLETLPLLMMTGGRRLHRVGKTKLSAILPQKTTLAEERVIKAIQRSLSQAKRPAGEG